MIPLRIARRDDVPALLDLWVEAWVAAMPGIDFDARRHWFETHIVNLTAEGAVTLLAEDAPTVLGFVTLHPGTGYLDQLAVRPARRGSGLATRLMAEAKRLGPGRLELHVNQDNPRAVRFYRREGFVVVGEGRNPHSNLAIWQMVWDGRTIALEPGLRRPGAPPVAEEPPAGGAILVLLRSPLV